MIGSYFLPARWRNTDEAAKPNFISRQITPTLLYLSRRACVHPIYTIVSVAILASTTYLGLLESTLFDRQGESSVGHVDFNSLLAGSKNLYTGDETAWKWHVEENGKHRDYDEVWHIVLLDRQWD
jgi:hydroxymethylglutaryl-CoA reductase (NADPH)